MHQPGTNNNTIIRTTPRCGAALRLLRFTGFCILAGTALTLFAGVVLLPSYARNLKIRHRLQCEQIRIRNAREIIDAMDELITAVEKDEILLSRICSSQIGLFPENEVVVMETGKGSVNPATLNVEPENYPPPPAGWIVEYGRKMDDPARRRGLLVMATAIILASLLIFPPPIAGTKSPSA